jgi:hypothetical protein
VGAVRTILREATQVVRNYNNEDLANSRAVPRNAKPQQRGILRTPANPRACRIDDVPPEEFKSSTRRRILSSRAEDLAILDFLAALEC